MPCDPPWQSKWRLIGYPTNPSHKDPALFERQELNRIYSSSIVQLFRADPPYTISTVKTKVLTRHALNGMDHWSVCQSFRR